MFLWILDYTLRIFSCLLKKFRIHLTELLKV